MDNGNVYEIKQPHKFNMRTVFVLSILPAVPGLIAGGGLGGAVFGIPVVLIQIIYYDSPVWLLLILPCLLFISLIVFWFYPGLSQANYYICSLVSHFRSNDGRTEYVCQIATQPRTYKGIRGFLEDADDVGIVYIEDGVFKFHGDCYGISINLSNVNVELNNIGYRSLWYAGRRIKIILQPQDKFESIDIVERQCWSAMQSRKLMLQIFEEIKANIARSEIG